jgi:hypothetical protein
MFILSLVVQSQSAYFGIVIFLLSKGAAKFFKTKRMP